MLKSTHIFGSLLNHVETVSNEDLTLFHQLNILDEVIVLPNKEIISIGNDIKVKSDLFSLDLLHNNNKTIFYFNEDIYNKKFHYIENFKFIIEPS